jgi:heptosyltransferase-3
MAERVDHRTGRGNARLRMLDETVGVGLLAVAGLLRKPRTPPAEIRRIGIMKSVAIGDMILASAVVNDVVRTFPAAQVVLFAGPDNEGIARLIEGVSVVVLPMARPWTAVRRLRRERVDVLLDLGQWTRLDGLCSFLSGARYTLGFETPGQRRHFAYDVTVTHSSTVHELENFRRLVETFGVEPRAMPMVETPDPGEKLALPAPRPYVVFHLWPGGFRSWLKEWPADSWRALATHVAEEGFSVVLTGSAGDVRRTEEFIRSSGGSATARFVNVAGRYPLRELAGVLREASCVVSVNTGVMHLAATVGAPTVALNGPTSELRWGPIGPRAVSVNSGRPGCGYLNLGFEYDQGRTDCMEGISVERVVETVHRLSSRG